MEMDIYMRRRLVALGGIVGFFIIVVLLFKSCGGDDETETPLTAVGATGTGAAAPLSKEDYIAAADPICGEINTAVAGIDPTDDSATQQELELTDQERVSLDSLVLADPANKVERFLGALGDLVDALETKQLATTRADDTAVTEADAQIEAAKAEAQTAAEKYGFEECGQFGEPGTGPTGTGTETTSDTGGAAPVTPVTPVTPTEPVTPAPTEPADPTTPPSDSGGITP